MVQPFARLPKYLIGLIKVRHPPDLFVGGGGLNKLGHQKAAVARQINGARHGKRAAVFEVLINPLQVGIFALQAPGLICGRVGFQGKILGAVGQFEDMPFTRIILGLIDALDLKPTVRKPRIPKFPVYSAIV